MLPHVVFEAPGAMTNTAPAGSCTSFSSTKEDRLAPAVLRLLLMQEKLAQCVGEGPTNAAGTWTRLWSPAAITVGIHSDTLSRHLKNLGFKSSTVKECIHGILVERLANVQFIPDEMSELTQSLSEAIKDRLKDEGFDRYKMVVQVVIGEQRGEGVNMAARCFWDADTDSYAHDVFMNDSLFCVVAAFGCFYY
ncbi:PREDICTED: tctex1 domain-containing protein 2 [Chaetura pelagica]|uniref:tctex1 domain-containing protein 2 n=1 Tax=Chaetura pelagica TaxID=8897 RepID=UPI00052318EA|nr:PREDICTED: tctex1 domain-containing protein 2 [Chaetura pelagica]